MEEQVAMPGKDELPPREREVLELLPLRWHDREIADHTGYQRASGI